jgi:hypothetical protein
VAVKLSPILANVAQIDEPINRPQQVILGNTGLQRDPIKQRRVRFLLWSHHRQLSQSTGQLHQRIGARSNKSFSTQLAGLRTTNVCAMCEIWIRSKEQSASTTSQEVLLVYRMYVADKNINWPRLHKNCNWKPCLRRSRQGFDLSQTTLDVFA